MARKNVRWEPISAYKAAVGAQGNQVRIEEQKNFFQLEPAETQSPTSKLLKIYRKNELEKYLSWHFTGRVDEISRIQRMLSSPKEGNTPTCCVLWGMTGVGKTQIALHYTQTAEDRNSVLWIPSSSKEELVEALESIHFSIFGCKDGSGKFQLLKSLLTSGEDGLKWLLVFDNVRTIAASHIISEFRPSGDRNGQILITTRTKAVAKVFSPNHFEIHPLRLEAAIDLCHCYSGCCHGKDHTSGLLSEEDRTTCSICAEENQAETRKKVREIVEGLGCHPLAIVSAGKKAAEYGVPWVYKNQTLVFHWPRSQKHLWQKKSTETNLKGAFTATFQELSPKRPKDLNSPEEPKDDSAERARTLLEILSVLDPTCVRLEMFSGELANLSPSQEKQASSKIQEFFKWAGSWISKESRAEPHPLPLTHIFGSLEYLEPAIDKLEELALVSRLDVGGGPPSFKTHKVIQLFVKTEIIRPSLLPEQDRKHKLLNGHCLCIQDAARIVRNVFSRATNPIDPQSWEDYQIHSRHARSLLNHAEYFMSKAKLSEPQKQKVEHSRRDLIIAAGGKAALYHWARGQYEDAVWWQDLTCRTKKELYEEANHETNISLERLGCMHGWSGNYKSAQKIFGESLTKFESDSSLQPAHILITLNRLAWVLLKRGRYEEAKDQMRKWVSLVKPILGHSLLWHSKSYRGVGKAVNEGNSWNKEEKVKIGEKGAIDEPEDDLNDGEGEKLNVNLGDSEDEEDDQVEEARSNDQGDNNDQYDQYDYSSQFQNGETYGGIKAGNLVEYALTGMGEVLALCFMFEGAYSKAKTKLSQVLHEQKRLLGSERPETRATVDNLMSVRCSLEEYDEAEEELILELKRRRQALGAEHPDTLTTKDNLALVYRRQRKYKEAGKLSEEVLKSREKLLGPDHPATLCSIHNVASVFRYQKQFTQAKELSEQAVKARTKLLGAEHPETLCSINNLALIYRSERRYAEAEKLNRQALKGRVKVLTANHPDTFTSLHSLGRTLIEAGKHKEAKEAFEEALEGREKILGNKHHDTLDTRNHLMIACQHEPESQKQLERLLKCPGKPEAHIHPRVISGTQLKAKAIERGIRLAISLSKKTRHELSITTSIRLTSRLGDAFFAQEKWERAEEMLQSVVTDVGDMVSIDPTSEKNKIELVTSLLLQRKFSRAEEISGLIIDKMQEISPDFDDAEEKNVVQVVQD